MEGREKARRRRLQVRNAIDRRHATFGSTEPAVTFQLDTGCANEIFDGTTDAWIARYLGPLASTGLPSTTAASPGGPPPEAR